MALAKACDIEIAVIVSNVGNYEPLDIKEAGEEVRSWLQVI